MMLDGFSWLMRFLITIGLALLLLLIGKIANFGIASLYYDNVSAEFKKTWPGTDPQSYVLKLEKWQVSLDKARNVVPLRPEYELLNDNIQRARNKADHHHLIVGALANSPTHPLLWARLAELRFRDDGPSQRTLDALDKALHFGPYDSAVLTTNAVIILYGWEALDEKRRRDGWAMVIRAARNPSLARSIRDIAGRTGQLPRLEQDLEDRHG